jgi:RNA-binding protein YlmH
MPSKREIESFLNRQSHLRHSKDDTFEILKVVSAYETVSRGRNFDMSGIIGRGQYNLIQELICSIGDNDVKMRFEGGYPDAERGRMVFLGPGSTSVEEWGLRVLELRLSDAARHRDVLGAMLSLGVQRSLIGDIGIRGSTVYVVVLEDMADFIMMNISRIGKSKVESSDARFCGEIDFPRSSIKEIELVAASMRVDLILSKIFRQSRKDVKNDIEKGKVKLNDFILDTANHSLMESDLVSYRNNGKIRIGKMKGMTKKKNIVVEIKKYV